MYSPDILHQTIFLSFFSVRIKRLQWDFDSLKMPWDNRFLEDNMLIYPPEAWQRKMEATGVFRLKELGRGEPIEGHLQCDRSI